MTTTFSASPSQKHEVRASIAAYLFYFQSLWLNPFQALDLNRPFQTCPAKDAHPYHVSILASQ
jgi:hypothetical protein